MRDTSRIPEDAYVATEMSDEDAGTDDGTDEDAPDGAVNFASDNNPEATNGPKQCTLPAEADDD